MATPVRPNVLRMHPYQPGKPISTVKRELGLDRVVKLASNENPFGPSPKAVAAMKLALSELNLYPDGAAFELRKALSTRFNVPMEQIAVGNGSEELIANIGFALIGSPEDEILTAEFSFPRYDAAAEIAPCVLRKIPLTSGWRFDLPAIAKAIGDRTKIIYIANPNNPTGTIVTKTEIDAFLRDVPDSALVVMDEAYFEFARLDPAYPDGREYVLKGRNVAALRTFSKAYGLAGIRAGYGFVPEYLAHAIDRVRAPFDLNSLAQVAAVAALEDDEHVRKTLANNAEGLAMMASALKEMGCQVVDSHANFLFVEVGRPGAEVFDALLRLGYIARPIGAGTFIRITVGTSEENGGFIEALRQVLS
ncbi:MAG TPA: histidinol-phosphate transaminase [Fimbriimonadaceae bacterium]|nr:histidinol-phosphate transaminase [Fimbriimonadaceae bacterium]